MIKLTLLLIFSLHVYGSDISSQKCMIVQSALPWTISSHLVVQEKAILIAAAEVPSSETFICLVQGVIETFISKAPEMIARHDEFDYG